MTDPIPVHPNLDHLDHLGWGPAPTTITASRWSTSDAPRGDDYDERWSRLAKRGFDIHGEADLVSSYGPTTVLDAGCGTGRVSVELARRGITVTGVDLDDHMLAAARRKAPDLHWVLDDLLQLDLCDGAGTPAASTSSWPPAT
jgi:SAM-dependent methyltransferase